MTPNIIAEHPRPTVDRDGGHSELLILLPVFNDWQALRKLLAALDRELVEGGIGAEVLVVHDGSTEPFEALTIEADYRAIRRVDVLRLRRNLGHQRAIAIGLAFVEAERPDCRAVVLMDSDGEDAPEDVPRLIAKYEAEGRRKIIFAERTKRSESLVFRVFYVLYRMVHRLLTGNWVRVGNFSVIPRRAARGLVATSELWNHYAAAAFTPGSPTRPSRPGVPSGSTARPR